MSHEIVPKYNRVYWMIAPDTAGRMKVTASYLAPPHDHADFVLIGRGIIPAGMSVSIPLVSDPSKDPSLRGPAGENGFSAYQLARGEGYGGTLTQWLGSLVGAPGASAYQIARAEGYGGTATQWLASLKGAAGKDAAIALGSITITETATLVAITAGTRRVTITVPAAWGITSGQALVIAPVGVVPAGYATHDVAVIDATHISVGITAPLLAIGASYSIPAKLARLNI